MVPINNILKAVFMLTFVFIFKFSITLLNEFVHFISMLNKLKNIVFLPFHKFKEATNVKKLFKCAPEIIFNQIV